MLFNSTASVQGGSFSGCSANLGGGVCAVFNSTVVAVGTQFTGCFAVGSQAFFDSAGGAAAAKNNSALLFSAVNITNCRRACASSVCSSRVATPRVFSLAAMSHGGGDQYIPGVDTPCKNPQ